MVLDGGGGEGPFLRGGFLFVGREALEGRLFNDVSCDWNRGDVNVLDWKIFMIREFEDKGRRVNSF